MALSKRQRDLCDSAPADYSDLRALFINCTLKKSPERSHTRGLIDVSRSMRAVISSLDNPPGASARDMSDGGQTFSKRTLRPQLSASPADERPHRAGWLVRRARFAVFSLLSS